MNKNIDIGDSYLILLFALLYGISFYPLKMFSKQNSWVVVIVANIIGFLFIKMILAIKNTYKNKNIFEINKIVLGNLIGNLINGILSAIFILLSAIISWYLFIFLKTNFLEKTPILFIAIGALIPIFYSINKSNLVIIKSNVIFSFIISVLTIIAIIFLLPQAELSNLKPFEEIKIPSMIYAIFCFFSITYLPTYALIGLGDIKFKNISKAFFKIFVLSLSIVLITYLVLGSSIAEMVDFPEFFVLRKIGLLANGTRIDSLIIIGWLISIYSINITLLFFVRNFLKNQIKNYKNSYSYLLIILVLGLSIYIFKNVTIGKTFVLNVLPYILFIGTFLVNLLIFITIKKKPKLVSHNNDKNY